MATPLVPSPLDCVGSRRFAFEPPLRSEEANEWRLGRSLRLQAEIVNAHSGRKLWLSRQYIAGISETGCPLLVVGLTKHLGVNGESLEPSQKGVIELPRQRPNRTPAKSRKGVTRANVVAIRLEAPKQDLWKRRAITGCVCAVVIALLTALVTSRIKF